MKKLLLVIITILFSSCANMFYDYRTESINQVLKVLYDAGFDVYDFEKEFRKFSQWDREIYQNWIYLKNNEKRARISYYSGDIEKMYLTVVFTESCGCDIAKELRNIYGCWIACHAHSPMKLIAPIQSE